MDPTPTADRADARRAAIRPTPEQYFMLLAVATRERAACLGRHVGAVLVSDKRIIATGYNGTPDRRPELRRRRLPALRQSDYLPGAGYDTCVCVHAEQNAILLAAHHGNSVHGGTSTRRCARASAAPRRPTRPA